MGQETQADRQSHGFSEGEMDFMGREKKSFDLQYLPYVLTHRSPARCWIQNILESGQMDYLTHQVRCAVTVLADLSSYFQLG